MTFEVQFPAILFRHSTLDAGFGLFCGGGEKSLTPCQARGDDEAQQGDEKGWLRFQRQRFSAQSMTVFGNLLAL
jgi:hypothetical protein